MAKPGKVYVWETLTRSQVRIYQVESLPVTCRAVPVCSPPPCRTRPPGCCPGTGSRSVDTPGTHSPSDDNKQTGIKDFM